MPPQVRIQLVSKMADIEHRLAYGTSDRLQLGALCGAFAGGVSQHLCGSPLVRALHMLPTGVHALFTPPLCFRVLAEAKEGIVAAAQ